MRESVFQTEWLHSFKVCFPYSHRIKIPDQPRFSEEKIRFAAVRPYDCYVLVDGRFYAYELKWMKTLTGFPIDRMSGHQISYLMEVEQAGGLGFIAINYRCNLVPEKTLKKFDLYSGKRLNFVYVMRIGTFRNLADTCSGKSIPFGDINDYPGIIRINRVKVKGETVWDIFKLREDVNFVV